MIIHSCSDTGCSVRHLQRGERCPKCGKSFPELPSPPPPPPMRDLRGRRPGGPSEPPLLLRLFRWLRRPTPVIPAAKARPKGPPYRSPRPAFGSGQIPPWPTPLRDCVSLGRDRMPPDMGVIQPAGFDLPLVYRLHQSGEIASVQQLGGPFLDVTPELEAAINADRRKTSHPKE